MKLVREKLYEDEEFKWIKSPDDKHEKILKSLEGKSVYKKLQVALQNDSVWLLKYLLDNHKDEESLNVYKIFDASVIYGKLNVANFLISSNLVDPSHHENKALDSAIEYDDFDMIRLLIKDKRVVNKLDDEEEHMINSLFDDIGEESPFDS